MYPQMVMEMGKNMMKYSKMVAGYRPLPKLNKNCTKTVGVSESGEADRQGLMLRPDGPLASKQLAPDSWFTAANTAQPLSALLEAQ